MTFSLAGRCERTGMVGAVISTSSPCVGARCMWVQAGAGVVLTQNVTNPALGPAGLAQMAAGVNANETLTHLLTLEPYPDYRQVAVLGGGGETAVYSGSQTLGIYATASGNNCIAAGNLLANRHIPQAMVDEFCRQPQLHLVDRLLAALEAGLAAGGEMGPVHSAALTVCDRDSWPSADLRVDWHDTPIAQLRTIWEVYQPQMAAYILRAKDPRQAPSYGVPGDE